MSMLAERRTKKKWCLNPNGKDWSNDDSKFGQRMLEKMGWKKGCGLGVNLQGMKEHVRVSAKNDTKGLGCKNNSDTEWIHHQQNFENLLSELACSTYEEIKPPATSETKHVSLEEKSKKSRVRVHYQKFTRGKDVTRYSANDLACIFGKKCSSLGSNPFDVQYSRHVNPRNICDSEADMISDEQNVEQSLNLHKEKTTDDSLPKRSAKDKPTEYSYEVKDVPEKQNDILKEISNMEENSVAESLEKIRSKKKKKRVKDSKNNQEVVTETMVSNPQYELNNCDTVIQENQNVILKEIANTEENYVAVVDLVEECKSEMLDDNSASHSSAKPLDKIRSKRKKKCVKDSENNEAVVTETKASSSQDEVNDCEIVVKEKQNGTLKKISTMEENSVAVVDLVEGCKSEMLDNSASQSLAESVEKMRSKRKRKRAKDSENNQEVVTVTIASGSQDELNDCETVVKEKRNGTLKDISNMEENSVAVVDLVEECEIEMLDNCSSHSLAKSLEKIRSKKKAKHVKGSGNNQEVVTETIVVSPQYEVNDCETVVHEVREEEKKKKKKKKKDKKYKVKIDDGTGKEDNPVFIEEVIDVISDAEETGNNDLETASLINKADAGGSKFKMKKKGKRYQTNISEECEECPEMKKRKKKKMCPQSLNEPDAVGDITSETFSPLPPDNKARVNNVKESRSFASEPFSSYKKESLQYDNTNAVKHRKTVRKHHRESTEFGFVGSNLHSISGYGSW